MSLLFVFWLRSLLQPLFVSYCCCVSCCCKCCVRCCWPARECLRARYRCL